MTAADTAHSVIDHHPKSDRRFYAGLGILSGVYVFLVLAMLVAAAGYAFVGDDVNHAVVNENFAAIMNNPKKVSQRI